MHKLIAQRLVVAWIALLGILFAALAPTLSHAVVPAVAAAAEVQICTANGMIAIAVDGGGPVKGLPAPDHMLKHCPYCIAHGGAPGLPPVQAFVLPVLRQTTSHPSLFYRSAAPLFAWTIANPRAPPALS
jgi:type II secretory pathway pseudopilin PulG